VRGLGHELHEGHERLVPHRLGVRAWAWAAAPRPRRRSSIGSAARSPGQSP
jgi:hypothetical protein